MQICVNIFLYVLIRTRTRRRTHIRTHALTNTTRPHWTLAEKEEPAHARLRQAVYIYMCICIFVYICTHAHTQNTLSHALSHTGRTGPWLQKKSRLMLDYNKHSDYASWFLTKFKGEVAILKSQFHRYFVL